MVNAVQYIFKVQLMSCEHSQIVYLSMTVRVEKGYIQVLWYIFKHLHKKQLITFIPGNDSVQYLLLHTWKAVNDFEEDF